MSETLEPDDLFRTYTRTVVETREVVEVTIENIGRIAARFAGQVDYAEDLPILILPSYDPAIKPWRIRIGQMLSYYKSGDELIPSYVNGFNHDGDWTEVSS